MKKSVLLLFTLLSSLGVAQISVTNFDRSLNGWVICVKPNCNPGGENPPAQVSQTIGNTTQSLEGSSMLLSQTSPAAGGSNALWTYKAGECDSCVRFIADFWYYPTVGATAIESDIFMFSASQQIKYMFGMQCETGKFWDIYDQAGSHWVTTDLPCNVLFGTWNHIRLVVYRVEGDTGDCGGYPCMHYETISVNEVSQTPKPSVEPAGPLPAGWHSTGFQLQTDTASPNMTVNLYLDLTRFTGLLK